MDLIHGRFINNVTEQMKLKKGDNNDFNNYRPVSILPTFSKIF